MSARVVITMDLTPWRESTPPGLLIRDWVPAHPAMPVGSSSGEPGLRGAAAAVRDEYPVVKGPSRWSWRIWTPIGTTWPYRSGFCVLSSDAQQAADAELRALIDLLAGGGEQAAVAP